MIMNVLIQINTLAGDFFKNPTGNIVRAGSYRRVKDWSFSTPSTLILKPSIVGNDGPGSLGMLDLSSCVNAD